MAIESRSLTIVVCGSSGRTADVDDTVDGADDFFFPNKFPNMALVCFSIRLNGMLSGEETAGDVLECFCFGTRKYFSSNSLLAQFD